MHYEVSNRYSFLQPKPYMEEQGTMVFLKRSYLRMIPLGFVGPIHEMLTTVGDRGTT